MQQPNDGNNQNNWKIHNDHNNNKLQKVFSPCRSLTQNNPRHQSKTSRGKEKNLLDIEADQKVERNVGLEAGGVDAEQLEDFSLVVRVEEDEAVEEGEKEVEDNKDDQVVVDQLQHRAPKRHNHLHILGVQ